ncbi:CRISPR-associated protein Cas4 [Sinanaerobacter sp. ZZT-01]|uniref:CRISPR-associated protein Cas4 n=1 Tax=Sinanaerobacter sp. ZZT-01 TaxID=3111540 RepID=UPI002D77131E|nr:CRISPR-associated protein Cas4 [Sinanaerobacter sp. ZZT-01]WRR92484.1 CRISPR-associated protein Cas4 [Sinanaerobacter sp. ZZT-01]
MKEYNEEDFLSISGIQHFIFCRRQWALIHIEQQWDENVRTVEGEHLHKRAHDESIKESRGDLIVSRGISVFSRTLGMRGVCDIVEFRKDKNGISLFGREGLFIPVPVEYKRGHPKEHDADILQLVAQCMCLEEMLACTIEKAYLYYDEMKRRQEVLLSEEHRQKIRKISLEMHELYERRYTPKVKMGKGCKACSLENLCMPKLCGKLSAVSYIEGRVKD